MLLAAAGSWHPLGTYVLLKGFDYGYQNTLDIYEPTAKVLLPGDILSVQVRHQCHSTCCAKFDAVMDSPCLPWCHTMMVGRPMASIACLVSVKARPQLKTCPALNQSGILISAAPWQGHISALVLWQCCWHPATVYQHVCPQAVTVTDSGGTNPGSG